MTTCSALFEEPHAASECLIAKVIDRVDFEDLDSIFLYPHINEELIN